VSELKWSPENSVEIAAAQIGEEEVFSYDVCMVFKAPPEDKLISEPAPRTTAVEIVNCLNASGLKTLLYLSVQKDEVYCLIGAQRSRLEKEAQRTEYELALDGQKCIEYGADLEFPLAKYTQERDVYSNLITSSLWRNLYGKFIGATKHLYQTYYEDSLHKNAVFRAVDRIKLIYSIIEAEVKLGGAGLGKFSVDRTFIDVLHQLLEC
jgi:hypothetical protein